MATTKIDLTERFDFEIQMPDKSIVKLREMTAKDAELLEPRDGDKSTDAFSRLFKSLGMNDAQIDSLGLRHMSILTDQMLQHLNVKKN